MGYEGRGGGGGGGGGSGGEWRNDIFAGRAS